MGDTGYIDWHRLATTWTDTGQGGTFVYAFWLADYDRAVRDHGVTLLKPEGSHPDWFLHAADAEQVILSVVKNDWTASPNLHRVYDAHMISRPAIASILLGTSSAVWSQADEHWWCSFLDLTKPGKKLLQALSTLYLRPPVILTYLNVGPISEAVPGTSDDSATVA